MTEKNIIGTNKSIILNASLSFSYNDTISQISQIIDAVELANKEGVLINVARGNHFGVSKYDFNYLAYLSLSYNNSPSIGATDVSGDRASYSNTGYHISVSAPGGGHHQILSTMPDYLNNNDFYGFGIIDAAKALILTKARPKNLRITNYNNRTKLMWDLIDSAILYSIYRGVDDGYMTEYFLIGRTTSNVNFYVDYSQRIESQTGSPYLMSYRVTANFSNNLESAFSNKANILVSMPTLEKFNFSNSFKLHQNFPNPFNNSTTIKLEIPEPGVLVFEIYNIIGEKIMSMEKTFFNPEEYELDLNLNLPSGVYFYYARINQLKAFRKMVIIN